MKKTKAAPKKELKDKTYILNDPSPWCMIRSAHARSKPLMYFDEESQELRELRYARNQKSPFVDEQKGVSEHAHIIFENGWLHVPKEQYNLQHFLDIHPDNLDNGGRWFYEDRPEDTAKEEVQAIELELEALLLVKDSDIDTIEAILRDHIGNEVSTMKSDILKREAMILAKEQPQLFIDLYNDDMLAMRNVVYKAIDYSIIEVSNKGRSIVWIDNGKHILTVPFGEDLIDYVAGWLTTDEGVEVLNTITKKLK